jgi:iron complex outermembrane receptor protein
MLAQDTGVVRPETSVAYELGWKTLLLKDRASLNVALFRDDFNDYQVNYADIYNGSPVTRFINAGSVSTKGVEADLLFYPVKNARFGFSMASTQARIDQFTIPPGAASSANINGQTMPFAPRFKMSASAEYRITLSESQAITLFTDYNWRSQAQYSINQTPDTIQPEYGIWNASATWNIGSRLKLSLLVKNITDQHYSTNLSTFSGGIVRWVPRDDQRYFGVSLHKDF